MIFEYLIVADTLDLHTGYIEQLDLRLLKQ